MKIMKRKIFNYKKIYNNTIKKFKIIIISCINKKNMKRKIFN